jgi:hypothetical protein
MIENLSHGFTLLWGGADDILLMSQLLRRPHSFRAHSLRLSRIKIVRCCLIATYSVGSLGGF